MSAVHHSHISVGSAGGISLQPLDLLYHLKARDGDTKDDVDSVRGNKRLIPIISAQLRNIFLNQLLTMSEGISNKLEQRKVFHMQDFCISRWFEVGGDQ